MHTTQRVCCQICVKKRFDQNLSFFSAFFAKKEQKQTKTAPAQTNKRCFYIKLF